MRELKILMYLNGAGGAPKVIGCTKDAYVCTCCGTKTFSKVVDTTIHQEVLLDAILNIAIRLQEIHCKGISHNHLIEENIMYDEETGTFNINDFGSNCAMGERLNFRATTEKLDEVDWMAPEAKHGEPVSPRSDVYSLGVLLGRSIFGFNSPNHLAATLAGKSICEDPDDRPSLEEFIDALQFLQDVDNKLFLNKATE